MNTESRCPTCGRSQQYAKHPDWYSAKERRRLVRRGKVAFTRHARNRLTLPDPAYRFPWPWSGRSRTEVRCLDPFHDVVVPPSPPRGRLGHNPDLARQKAALSRALQGKERR